MNSQSNTFRLHKLSRTNQLLRRSSLSIYEPKETFKLAALRSITNGIKHNNLSMVTGMDLNKLRVEHNQTQDLFYLNSHETFTNIRKKYDQVKKQRVSKEQFLTRLKEELQNVKGEEAQYLNKKTNAHNLSQNLSNALADKRLLYEQTSMNKKCLDHIVYRLKEDKIVYDHRKFKADKQLDQLTKHFKIIHEQGNAVDESTERTRLVYQKLVKQIQNQQRQRQQHIAHMTESIRKLKQLNALTDTRGGQMKEIAQRAMQDKDQNQKKWKNLLIVHKFISHMLRDKMEREMNKFRIVESAFKNIKIATGTSDTQSLVSKFLNKEVVYGELLSTIAQNQKKIQKLKSQRQILLKQRKQIEDEQNLFEITRKVNTDLSKQIKNLGNSSQKSEKIQLQNQKFFAWLIKQHKKIAKIQGKDISTIKYTRQNLSQAVIDLFVWMEKNIQNSEKVQINKNFDNYELNKRDIQKLFRIRPRKMKKNQKDQEILEQEEDQADIIQSTNVGQQQDILSHARVQLLKSNEKFMKQVKKKREQILKMKLQMSPKKKQKEPEKKKQDQ